MTQSSSEVQTASLPIEETSQPRTKKRLFVFLGYLIFSFGILGFCFDLFEMGRIFWGVFLIWLLIVRLILVIKRPDLQPSGEQNNVASANLPIKGTLE
jgi:hypothetical protein